MLNSTILLDEEFSFFQKAISEESGFNFTGDRGSNLRQALLERIEKTKCVSSREYRNMLSLPGQGSEEIRKLINLITIGETYFFRQPAHFEALMKFVLPEIVRKKGSFDDKLGNNKSIRVWSAGCSRGDEPYSIAIAIMEALPSYKEWNISVLGTDINKDVLDYAKKAVYTKRSIEQLPHGYLENYFLKQDNGYVLKEEVKKIVKFQNHNLAKDTFISQDTQGLDIIFCRNVTIYFDFVVTKRIIENFYNCLKTDGYLFIGHAETLWQMTDKFQIVEFPQAFVYKKALYPVMQEQVRPFVAVPDIDLEEISYITQQEPPVVADNKEEKPVFKDKSRISSLYKKAAEFFEDRKYVEALSLLDEVLELDSKNVRSYLAKATILANQARYKEAILELSKIIKVDNLCIEAYYLLGTLFYKIGDLKEAEAQFKKVVYIDSEATLAYFDLGNIYLCQGKYKQAVREFSNDIKILEKRPMDESVRFCEGYNVEFLLRACRNNLEELKKRCSQI